MPSSEELTQLPLTALVALASWAADLVHVLYQPRDLEISQHVSSVKKAIEESYYFASEEIGLDNTWVTGAACARAEDAASVAATEAAAAAAMAAAHAANAARDAELAMERGDGTNAARSAGVATEESFGNWHIENTLNSVDAALRAANEAVRLRCGESSSAALQDIIRQGFDSLLQSAMRNRWVNHTKVDRDIFPLGTVFDLETLASDDKRSDTSTILQITPEIDARLVDYFRRFPQRLFSLDPREFEELIAELWAGFGFTVEMTARTRDGGRDVIAIKQEPALVKYLIECKRYSKTKRVGVSVVRQLHGVIVHDGASKGIVATTSRFTGPAIEYMKATPWVLEGCDYAGIVRWLHMYQETKLTHYVGTRVHTLLGPR